ncbi:solute carrier family 22 member 7-like [Salvelinus fontinalis]|uniref:solute carrier family 22 member 7-like n=1 Tax=Salvelinus fontinalis TaxID=8038 RepID=UPI0024857BF7|nr:solute carrier family 22 member 7-like [Salvelinus fontinalis]
MKFDNILEEIDGCGWFQVLIVTLLCVPRVILPCHFLLNNFIAAVPSHHCDLSALDDGGLFGNLTQEQRLTVSVPVQEDGTPRSCKMFPEPQFQLLSNSNDSDLVTVPCQNGWAYDNSTFKSTMATEWDLVCDRKGMNKATATIFFVGVMIGAIAFGTLTDKFGRKPMLLVSYTISMVFGFASAFSNSYTMFGVMRFFTGFGLTGISIISTVLSLEWVDIKHRALIGITGSMAWSFGNMMLAGIAYQVNDWRMLMIAVSAPLGLAIITWWWLPESARWLIANGKVERAHLYLEKCARFNNRKDFTSKIKLEHLSDVVGMDNHNKTYSYLDLVRTPKMRRLALLTGIVWYGVASTYYGISLNITGFGLNVYLTHFIYSAIEVPAKMVVYFCLDTIGRKHCQAGTLLLTGTCIAINIFVPKGQWHVRTIVAVLGKGLSEASFTTVILYTAELYPTVVRQNGLGYNNFMARLGVSIAPLIILLEDVWKPLPEVIICCVSILSGLVAFLLPETHNARLPETIEDIEQTKKRSPIFVSPLEKTEVLLKSQKNNELDQ